MGLRVGQRNSSLFLLLLSGLFANCVVPITSSMAQEQEGNSSKERMPTAQINTLVQSAIETILKEHIEPPTRQQMVLEFLRQLGIGLDKPVSLNLSLIVSDARDREQVYWILAIELQRIVGADARSSDILKALKGIGKLLEGGLALDTRSNVRAEEQLAANRYVGIGVQTTGPTDEKELSFMKVYENGPAFDAGVLDNDILDSVDGHIIKGLSMTEAIQLLRGLAGTSVKLSVRTPGASSRDLILIRRMIPLKTLELIETNKERRTLLIRIDRVSASSLNELQNIVITAESAGEPMQTIVLDVQTTFADNIHNLHLFADGLLDATTLCKVQTRKGIRPIMTEDGKALDQRRIVLLTAPGHNQVMDLLVNACSDAKLSVFFAISDLDSIQADLGSRRGELPVIEPFEIAGTEHYIKFATSRFLDRKGKPFPSGLTVGTALSSAVRMVGWKPLVKREDSILNCVLNSLVESP